MTPFALSPEETEALRFGEISAVKVAAARGVSPSTVQAAARRAGVRLYQGRRGKHAMTASRDAAIVAARLAGEPAATIAARHGLTPCRVYQITQEAKTP